MIKIAGMEETQITDPASGKPIRVSTTTRKLFRHVYRNANPEFMRMRNAQLNEIIAKMFAENSHRIVHTFKLGKRGDPDRETAEIRGSGGVRFFIAARRGESMDILVYQNAFKSPKVKKAVNE